MEIKLRYSEAAFGVHAAHHRNRRDGRETISFAFGRWVPSADGATVLVTEQMVLPFGDDCFDHQGIAHVALARQVLLGSYATFASSGCDVLINCHNHPCVAGTRFSGIDDADDVAQARYLASTVARHMTQDPRTGRRLRPKLVSVVFDEKTLDARFVEPTGAFHQIAEVQVVGSRHQSILPNGLRQHIYVAPPDLARQRQFMTCASQEAIARATVGVIGIGGIGSIVSETLYRIGFRNFEFFDPDVLERSNLNRWQGARGSADLGRNKARLQASRLRQMAERDVEVHAVPLSILDPEALRYLRRCDVLVGCLDNAAARLFLNRYSLAHLTPWFDAGVAITTAGGVEFQSRSFTLVPGVTACAECSAFRTFDLDEAWRGLGDELAAEAQRSLGYVVDDPGAGPTPSAYPLNQIAAGMTCLEVLNYFAGFIALSTTSAFWWSQGRVQRAHRENFPEHPNRSCYACAALTGAGTSADLPRPLAASRTAGILRAAREKRACPSPGEHERHEHGRA